MRCMFESFCSLCVCDLVKSCSNMEATTIPQYPPFYEGGGGGEKLTTPIPVWLHSVQHDTTASFNFALDLLVSVCVCVWGGGGEQSSLSSMGCVCVWVGGGCVGVVFDMQSFVLTCNKHPCSC